MRFFILLILLFLHLACSVRQFLHSDSSEWEMISKMHVEHVTSVADINLTDIVEETWVELVTSCPSLPSKPRINIFFDYTLENTSVLAFASQTLYLNSNAVWVSTIYDSMKKKMDSTPGTGNDMTIGFNPNPPNGWFVGKNCTDISYRYDLRTVLKHELLHGIIFAGSVREYNNQWIVGYSSFGVCYPRLYDTMIRFSDNTSILGGNNSCNLRTERFPGYGLYIDGIQLYHPYYYRAGSSISHHNYYDHLMYPSISPMKCLDLEHQEGVILAKLGLECTVGNTTYKSDASKNEYRGILFIFTLIILLY